MRNYRYILLIILVLAIVSCNRPIRYDLIVENASIFDTKTGGVIPQKTILIIGDTIVGIINSDEPVRTKKVVDADGRLVVPGFIDTHINFEKAIYSTHKNADNHPKTLTTFYRSKFSKLFLPFGVTTAVDMTRDLNWANQMVKWEKNPKFSDLLVAYNFPSKETSRGRIDISISDLSSIGVKYLYINDNSNSDFVGNVHQIANDKKLDVFVKPISKFTDNKIENIEHIYSPIISLVETHGYKDLILKQIENVYGSKQEIPEEIYALEAFKFVVENNPKLIDTLVNKLSGQSFSISTTLHSLAQYSDSIYFKSTIDSQIKLTKELRHRITYSFNHFQNFVKRIYDSGTVLRIGTNCSKGGLTFISEQLLLAEAGIPASDILKISTINAAKVLKIDNQFGSIEVGKKADLVIFDQNPLEDTKNFASNRRVIKGGKLFKKNPAKIDMEE